MKPRYALPRAGRTYYYAWRGGPRLKGEPGTPEFIASYNEAVEGRKAPDTNRFRSLVVAYKASADYRGLAESTRRQWAPWFDRIVDYFGDLRIAQFERPEKIRPVIRRWRNKWADTPRTADFGMQVLSRVLAYAVDPLGKVAGNPCEGIKRLYTSDRRDIIWTDADIAQLKAKCSREVAWTVDLAVHTGLRQGDLLKLAWTHVQSDAIVTTTGKSGHRREVVVPLYDDLKVVLDAIPKRATTILTNSRGLPWKTGFSASFNKAKIAAGLDDRDLHFHDLRGTAATRFYVKDLPMRVIAETLGWEEDNVERIIRRYVGRQAATLAFIERMNKAKRGT